MATTAHSGIIPAAEADKLYKYPAFPESDGSSYVLLGNAKWVQGGNIGVGSAKHLMNTHYLGGHPFDGTQDINYYFRCDTKAGEAAKVCTVPEGQTFHPHPGAWFYMWVSNAEETVSAPLTLNVGGTGAKPWHDVGNVQWGTRSYKQGPNGGVHIVVVVGTESDWHYMSVFQNVPRATSVWDGLLSSADKRKLDAINETDGTATIQVAERLINKHYIGGHLFDGTQDVDFYFRCDSAANVKDKVVTVPSGQQFELHHGAWFFMWLNATNTATGNLTLNVGGTGALPWMDFGNHQWGSRTGQPPLSGGVYIILCIGANNNFSYLTVKYPNVNATAAYDGLMAAADKAKLDSLSSTTYTHPSYTARTGKPTANATPAFGATFTVSQITSDATGHVTNATDRTVKIPNTAVTTSASGLMTAAMLSSLQTAAADIAALKSAIAGGCTATLDANGNMVFNLGTYKSGFLTISKAGTY